MGLGFTPESEKPVNQENMFGTLVDNLEDHDAFKNKFFSFYLPENEGFVTFGEVPSHIVKDEKLINWAPLIPDNENPWSVRMSDIVIQSNKRTGRRRRNRYSFLQLNSKKFHSKV